MKTSAGVLSKNMFDALLMIIVSNLFYSTTNKANIYRSQVKILTDLDLPI